MKSHLDREFQKLESCIHCGMCLSSCPTYRVTGSEAESPRGRLYMMREFAEGNLKSLGQISAHLNQCVGCLACVTACPSGVDYETVLMAFRSKITETQPLFKRIVRRFFLKKVIPNPKILNIMVKLIRFYNLSGLRAAIRMLHPEKLPYGKLEQFIPAPQSESPLKEGLSYGRNRKGRAALFLGCVMNALYPQVHKATVEILAANGYEVITTEQTCCGALAHHCGESDILHSLAEKNIESILFSGADWIVVNAAGCGATLKEYRQILSNHPRASIFSDKVVDILELLAKEPLEGELSPISFIVAYHAACHLHHAQGIQDEPYSLLSQIPGIKLVPLTDSDICCGSGGVYSLTNTDLSLAILKYKIDNIEDTEADFILTANPGCMLQLETGIRNRNLPVKVLHPVELIWMSYRASYKQNTLHLVNELAKK